MNPKNRIFKKSDGAKSRTVSGKEIIVNVHGRHFYQLNETGTIVWNLINGRNSVGKIMEIVGEEFDAWKKDVEEDVLALIGNLEKEKLIELK